MSNRKTKVELINLLFDQISDTPRTPTQIAEIIGAHPNTVRNLVDIIELIQSKPRISIERGTTFTLVKRSEKNQPKEI